MNQLLNLIFLRDQNYEKSFLKNFVLKIKKLFVIRNIFKYDQEKSNWAWAVI